MAVTMPEITDTRARMIRAYRSALEALIEDATQRPGDSRDEDTGELVTNLGDWDGVPVVTRKRLDQAISAVFGQSIPAPSETTVEVSTPATILASVGCPRCEIPSLISVSIHGELLTDDEGSELRAKPKSKPVPHICGQLQMPESDEDSERGEQTGLMEAIESLAERVHGLLGEVAALPGEEDGEEMPSLEVIASWDRATIDQVDRWATALLAVNGEHPETCSARFATDGTTGERICDCGLADFLPDLPRVLGGVADPEPADEPDANDVDFGEGAPNADETAADAVEGDDPDDLLPA